MCSNSGLSGATARMHNTGWSPSELAHPSSWSRKGLSGASSWRSPQWGGRWRSRGGGWSPCWFWTFNTSLLSPDPVTYPTSPRNCPAPASCTSTRSPLASPSGVRSCQGSPPPGGLSHKSSCFHLRKLKMKIKLRQKSLMKFQIKSKRIKAQNFRRTQL